MSTEQYAGRRMMVVNVERWNWLEDNCICIEVFYTRYTTRHQQQCFIPDIPSGIAYIALVVLFCRNLMSHYSLPLSIYPQWVCNPATHLLYKFSLHPDSQPFITCSSSFFSPEAVVKILKIFISLYLCISVSLYLCPHNDLHFTPSMSGKVGTSSQCSLVTIWQAILLLLSLIIVSLLSSHLE